MNTLSTEVNKRWSSPSKRIAQIASSWNSQYPGHVVARAKEHGASDEEIAEGFRLGRAMSDERRINYRVYGDPAYGSWPIDAKNHMPIRAKVSAMMEDPIACQECGSTRESVVEAGRGLRIESPICCEVPEVL